MELIDIVILLIILLGGVIGFKEGALKKLTSAAGLIIIVVLSFILKNKISFYFYENLPFIKLWGVFKGIQVLNIIVYEMVAFLVIASVLVDSAILSAFSTLSATSSSGSASTFVIEAIMSLPRRLISFTPEVIRP